MRARLKQDLRMFVIALLAFAVVYNGPAIAHGVKHALFAHKARTAANAGKLSGKTIKQVQEGTGGTDLRVTQTYAVEYTSAGPIVAHGVFTATVHNSGNRAAREVRLVANPSGGESHTVVYGDQLCNNNGFGTWTCQMGTLAPGATATVIVNVSDEGCDNGPYGSVVTVDGWNWETDTSDDKNSNTNRYCIEGP